MLTRLGPLLLIATAFLAGPAAPLAGHEEVSFEVFPQPDSATRFRNDFGAARAGHRHEGTDLLGDKGMAVVAVADGVVKVVAHSPTAGNYVVIAHQGDWETWYIHLNNDSPGTDDGSIGPLQAVAPGIEEGAFVAAGQPLGWVGDSGNAEGTTPHTHFEVHHNERIINPYPYLKRVWDLLNFRWDMGNRVL